MMSVSKTVSISLYFTTIKSLKSAYMTGAKSMLKCRFPIDFRVYRKTRVLSFGKTSLLRGITAILGGTDMRKSLYR